MLGPWMKLTIDNLEQRPRRKVGTLALGTGFFDLDRKRIDDASFDNDFGLEMTLIGGAGPVSAGEHRFAACPPRNFSTGDDVLPVLAKRSPRAIAEALPIQGGYRPPSPSFKDTARMPDNCRFGCIAMSTGAERCTLRARPAAGSGRSGRQRRRKPDGGLGECRGAGAKTGAATSVGGIINTFDECGSSGKGQGWRRSILPLGPRDMADFGLMSVTNRPHGRSRFPRSWPPKAALPGGQDGLHSGVRHSLGTPAPRSRFQTAPWPGRFFLTRPERRYVDCWSSPADVRARHTAPPTTGSCARCPGRDAAACLRQILKQFRRPGVGLSQAAPDNASHDGVGEVEVIGARRQLDQAVAHRGFSLEASRRSIHTGLILVGLEGLEPQPDRYERPALTIELQAPPDAMTFHGGLAVPAISPIFKRSDRGPRRPGQHQRPCGCSERARSRITLSSIVSPSAPGRPRHRRKPRMGPASEPAGSGTARPLGRGDPGRRAGWRGRHSRSPPPARPADQ